MDIISEIRNLGIRASKIQFPKNLYLLKANNYNCLHIEFPDCPECPLRIKINEQGRCLADYIYRLENKIASRRNERYLSIKKIIVDYLLSMVSYEQEEMEI